MLVDLGAEVNSICTPTPNNAQTPLDCALQKGYRSIAKYFQAIGGLPANKIRLSSRNKVHKRGHVKPLTFNEKEEIIDIKSNVKRYVVYVERSKSQEALCDKMDQIEDSDFTRNKQCRCKNHKRRTSSYCNNIHKIPSSKNADKMIRSKSNLEIRSLCDSHHTCANSLSSSSSSSTSSLISEEHYSYKRYSNNNKNNNKKSVYKYPKFQVLNKRSKSNDKYCSDNKYCDSKYENCRCRRRDSLRKYHSDSSNDNFDSEKVNVNKIDAYKKYITNLNKEENSQDNKGDTSQNINIKTKNEEKKDVGLQAFSSPPSSAQGRKSRPQSARPSSAKKRLDSKLNENFHEQIESEIVNLQNILNENKDNVNYLTSQITTEAQIHAPVISEPISDTKLNIGDKETIVLQSEGTFIVDKTVENLILPEQELHSNEINDQLQTITDVSNEITEISKENVNLPEELNATSNAISNISEGSDIIDKRQEEIIDTTVNVENIQKNENDGKSFTLADDEPDMQLTAKLDTNNIISNENQSFTIIDYGNDEFNKHPEEKSVIVLETINTSAPESSFTVIDDNIEDIATEFVSVQDHSTTEEVTYSDEAFEIDNHIMDSINYKIGIDKNGRRKKFKRKIKSKTSSDETTEVERSLDNEQIHQGSKDQDSGFEPSPRAMKTKVFVPKTPKKIAFTTLDNLDEHSLDVERKPGDENAVNMATVSISMQKNIQR